MDNKPEKILVLGAGNFGTCLAHHLAEEEHEVTIWARNQQIVDSINTHHKNPKYLSTITLSPQLRAINKIDAELLNDCSVILFSTSTQSMRSVLTPIRQHLHINQLFISAVKGIEIGTLKLPNQIVEDVCGREFAQHGVFLSGPSFAAEVANKLPTAVAVASHVRSRAQWAQDIFHAPHFRVYSSDDPTGIEIAGALKNVIAIASGACTGLGFQMNTRAGLITRGLGEIMRVGTLLGAKHLTFLGLGGVGDLFLTCSSEKSRNFTFGYRLGKGESPEHILKTMDSIAEGYSTAKAAFELTQKIGARTPIIEEVYKVLYEAKPVKQALYDLVTREAKSEFE